jgi:outer membrane lipoprotein SlyB
MLMTALILSCLACENLGNLSGSSSQAHAYPISSHVNGNATIESIEVISRSQSLGLGTLAGAAIGGLLGYQVGGGTGKTVTTIAGAAGGAYVGHELEKKQAKDDRVYKVTLRMDDGTIQSFAQETEPILKQGDKVKITNGVVSKL